jgi:hypothetical protein
MLETMLKPGFSLVKQETKGKTNFNSLSSTRAWLKMSGPAECAVLAAR